MLADARTRDADLNGGLHHPREGKRVVQLFMSGAASQCDTFDYKPELIRSTARQFDPGGKVELFQSSPGAVHEEPVGLAAARRSAASGSATSLPHLAGCVDDMAFLPSMVSQVERPRAGDVHAEHRVRRCPASPAWAPGSATAWAA